MTFKSFRILSEFLKRLTFQYRGTVGNVEYMLLQKDNRIYIQTVDYMSELHCIDTPLVL